MRYQVRVAGKVFESNDIRALLRRAVEAKRASLRADGKTASASSRLVTPQALSRVH